MKTNPNDDAFPIPAVSDSAGSITYDAVNGLTKREYFAAMAMQGMTGVIGLDPNHTVSAMVCLGNRSRVAIAMADALIAELNKEVDEN